MGKVHPEFRIYAGRQTTDPMSTEFALFEFDIPDNLSAAKVMLFIDAWKYLLEDCDFGTAGHHNNSAVNLCCLLHVAGIKDIVDWFDTLDQIIDLSAVDYHEMNVCIERIIPYLEKWGPEGKEEQALCFMV